jgi:subtilase family serine protease
VRLSCEELEARDVPSAAAPAAGPGVQLAKPAAGVTNNTVVGYTPDQIRTAYGFYGIPGLGTPAAYNASAGKGETIAIIDVTNDPNILGDANFFSQQFGLPQFNQAGGPTFTKVNENGSTSGLPTTVNSQWSGEIALDVEWAHAIAPQANIVLVEANALRVFDLVRAINTARAWQGVTAVSMSFGGPEFAGISFYDQFLTTPPGHPGVTFVASTLDNGAYYHNRSAAAPWPAVSPNVLAVGGTTLNLNPDNTIKSETAWSFGGGGLSKFEFQGSYQKGFVSQSTTQRANPDVAYDADLNTGFAVYDTVPANGQTGWFKAGGTSAGVPQWAALVTLADQERGAGNSLDGPTQTLPALYQLAANPTTYAADFHDVTTGGNGFPAGPGYDLATGLGTPQAAALVQALAAYSG